MFFELPTTCVKEVGSHFDLYVPGAGFSGFFYTLGRLHALHSVSSQPKEYYCFSAGCLALITSVMNMSVDQAIEIAHSSRDQWMMGDISRYDVVEVFVDRLLSNVENAENITALEVDEKVNLAFDAGNRECRTNRTMESDPFDGGAGECANYIPNIRSIERDTVKYSLQRTSAQKLQDVLPRINVITSVWNKRYLLSQTIQKPSSIAHLKRLLVQTTWM